MEQLTVRDLKKVLESIPNDTNVFIRNELGLFFPVKSAVITNKGIYSRHEGISGFYLSPDEPIVLDS